MTDPGDFLAASLIRVAETLASSYSPSRPPSRNMKLEDKSMWIRPSIGNCGSLRNTWPYDERIRVVPS